MTCGPQDSILEEKYFFRCLFIKAVASEMRSSVVLLILTFAVLGILLGFSSANHGNSPQKAGNYTGLELNPDKQDYKEGEQVTFTVQNSGSENLVFPDFGLGLSITDTNTGQTFSPVSVQVITSLGSGDSKQLPWPDSKGAPSGNYTASIHTASGYSPIAIAQARFTIHSFPSSLSTS